MHNMGSLCLCILCLVIPLSVCTSGVFCYIPVSYTHLDVYKRQVYIRIRDCRKHDATTHSSQRASVDICAVSYTHLSK